MLGTSRNIDRRVFRAVLFLLVQISLGGVLFTAAQELVRIKGRVIVPAHLIAPVHLTMDVGDTACVRVRLKGRGRFRIETTDTERYLMRFEQEGAISKTVQVDTRFVDRKAGTRRTDIAFDVQLAPADTLVPLRYAGPVGRIAFHHSNGRIQVQRDRTMVHPAVSIWPP